jgi:putative transposase
MRENYMIRNIEQERQCAVLRFLYGEDPASICTSLGRSTRWLYKWINRYTPRNASWSESQSRRPYSNPSRTPADVEEIIIMIRLYLYFQGLCCGAEAIRRELKELHIRPMPSLSTINRIFRRRDLMDRGTGGVEPKGNFYPRLPAEIPNQVHQADLVGPCSLKSPISFYSLNVVDVNTGRCGVQPLSCNSVPSVIDGLRAIWARLGIPCTIQVDNEILFYGSQAHPHSVGPIIRFFINNGVEPWLIPTDEPWRNGAVKMLNIHYQQKFLNKIMMTTEVELRKACLGFENNHNRSYRYGGQCGQTPLKALAGMGAKLIFPAQDKAPRYPLKRQESGRCHLIRYIGSDLSLTILGERFAAPPETINKYIVASIDVREQKLKLFMDNKQIDEYHYQTLD